MGVHKIISREPVMAFFISGNRKLDFYFPGVWEQRISYETATAFFISLERGTAFFISRELGTALFLYPANQEFNYFMGWESSNRTTLMAFIFRESRNWIDCFPETWEQTPLFATYVNTCVVSLY